MLEQNDNIVGNLIPPTDDTDLLTTGSPTRAAAKLANKWASFKIELKPIKYHRSNKGWPYTITPPDELIEQDTLRLLTAPLPESQMDEYRLITTTPLNEFSDMEQNMTFGIAGAKMKLHSLLTLAPGVWLNDEVVMNSVYWYINRHIHEFKNTAYMSTYFLAKYMGQQIKPGNKHELVDHGGKYMYKSV